MQSSSVWKGKAGEDWIKPGNWAELVLPPPPKPWVLCHGWDAEVLGSCRRLNPSRVQPGSVPLPLLVLAAAGCGSSIPNLKENRDVLGKKGKARKFPLAIMI